MLCAISGEVPQAPVVSRRSGNVFEKRLIEAYISEHGADPTTNEELSLEDLIELKTNRIAKPRPPTLTSIPSLLSVFQNEWDALALETFTLRQHLQQARQELSTALYQNDAAVRVIARLTRERDEARTALSKISINGSSAENGHAADTEGAGLPEPLVAEVQQTQERLSKTRRKRAVPEDWATAEALSSLGSQDVSAPKGKCLCLDDDKEHMLLGSASGEAVVLTTSGQETVRTLSVGAVEVTDVAWIGARAAVASSDGKIHLFEPDEQFQTISGHRDAIKMLAVHPSKSILASVGHDNNIVLYSVSPLAMAMQIRSAEDLSTIAFHPDGHILATGSSEGRIAIHDVKSGQRVGAFDCDQPVQSLDFSENGTWLATTCKQQDQIQIWDLRKSSQIKVLDLDFAASSIRWDYTGQFLAAVGPGGITILNYAKAAKAWSETFKSSEPSIAVSWGSLAKSLYILRPEGTMFSLS